MRVSGLRCCGKAPPCFHQAALHGHIRIDVTDLRPAFRQCRMIEPLQGAARHKADLFIAA
jgi:hypothetical protein